MDDKSLVVQTPPQLSPVDISKLETYEDCLSYYIQLEQASSDFSWAKADVLYQMSLKMGDHTLKEIAKTANQNENTVGKYIRLVRAFPPEERNPALPFSIHLEAMNADSFDDHKKEFKTNDRFRWLQRANDENLSVRKLKREMNVEKARKLSLETHIEPWMYDGLNKTAELRSLIEGLAIGIKDRDKNAFDKLERVYNRVFHAQDNT